MWGTDVQSVYFSLGMPLVSKVGWVSTSSSCPLQRGCCRHLYLSYLASSHSASILRYTQPLKQYAHIKVKVCCKILWGLTIALSCMHHHSIKQKSFAILIISWASPVQTPPPHTQNLKTLGLFPIFITCFFT
jgi:hypothetical protein